MANSDSGLYIHLSTDSALFRRPVVRYLKRPNKVGEIYIVMLYYYGYDC